MEEVSVCNSYIHQKPSGIRRGSGKVSYNPKNITVILYRGVWGGELNRVPIIPRGASLSDDHLKKPGRVWYTEGRFFPQIPRLECRGLCPFHTSEVSICPRDLSLSALWGLIMGLPKTHWTSRHYSIERFKGALNWSPLCREILASRIADVIFSILGTLSLEVTDFDKRSRWIGTIRIVVAYKRFRLPQNINDEYDD